MGGFLMEKYKVYISNVTKKMSRNDNPFLILDLNIADSDKNNEGVFVWDNVEQTYEVLESGMTGEITVDGMAKDYTKMLGFDEKELEPSMFMQTAFGSLEKSQEVFDYMLEIINKDATMKKLNDSLWTQELIDQYIWAPGAKAHHHAVAQGLVFHTYELFQYVKSILESNYYKDKLDKAVVLEGILLHDLGKIYDYELDEFGSVHYQKANKWTSHLHKAAAMVEDAVDMSNERYQHVVHCILAHHGRKEWNAIVEPKTPEAHLVHQADAFSTQLNKSENTEYDEEGIGQNSKFIQFRGENNGT